MPKASKSNVALAHMKGQYMPLGQIEQTAEGIEDAEEWEKSSI
jgi:hypothetical protein